MQRGGAACFSLRTRRGAAKGVGAGEFADFARYMPNLIAGASNLGIAYKEVAGTFAYMTGKGQSAERAAVLMENAFSVLGRVDVVINKVDKPNCRPEVVNEQVFDLMFSLDATEEQLDYKTIYGSAKQGWMSHK